MVKISVIMPMYNVEDFVGECIESILSQTMEEWELICVNDGSRDRSPQIAEEYAGKDRRIKVIHKENGGLSSARNLGMEYAKDDSST
ncbi:MAG TPA: glycosyltransferase family 2 protein, partial [Candidatus Limivivens merdigallinarum]|nr:glycosyltransferase family 2 protein [Candidatus Limivivens merdigallinarum]